MRFRGKFFSTLAISLALMAAAAAPAVAASWVRGHYAPNGAYIPGHWVGGEGVWVVGHYAPNGVWISGHWRDGEGPAPGRFDGPPGPPPFASHWIPGHFGPGGLWHPGHWAHN